jgi:hypothetical protein
MPKSVFFLHELADMAKVLCTRINKRNLGGWVCVSYSRAKGRRWANVVFGASYMGGELYY